MPSYATILTSGPEGDKSIGQKASDTVSGTGEGSGNAGGQGVLAQAQDAAGNALNTVKDTLGLNEPSTLTLLTSQLRHVY